MEFRYVGNSGLKISEITYGNWLTHGSQVENDQATACVRAALDAGITTFDTADVYANTKAETVLGAALKGERRESLEILTKVYWPTGPGGPNDVGLSRKHIMESINGSLTRLQTDYVDLYQAHRYDSETPLEETMQAFADLVRMGKVLYVGVSEWTAQQIKEGHDLAEQLGIQLISNQPQYSMLWRVIEGEVVPTCVSLGMSQIVFSPIAQGVLTGKYRPGEQPPPGSRATVAGTPEPKEQDGCADVRLAVRCGSQPTEFPRCWAERPQISRSRRGTSSPTSTLRGAPTRRVGPLGSAGHRGGQDDIDVLEHMGTFDPRAAARRKEEPLSALLVVQALAGDQRRVVLDGVDIAPYRGDPVAARGAVVQHQIDLLADGDQSGEVLLKDRRAVTVGMSVGQHGAHA